MKVTTDIFDSGRAAMAIGCLARNASSRDERRFPMRQRESVNFRIGHEEPLHHWFCRVIGQKNDAQRISDCSLEENLAFFGKVSWKDDTILQCSFQALVTKTATLQEFYLQNNQQAQYYRFDLDPAAPGPLFAEPQPHIHCIPEGAPRFPIAFGQGEYCLITFLEFIYRNHFYDKWLSWVKSVSKEAITVEQFDDLIVSFDTGRVKDRITELAPLLERLTKTLRQRKRDQVSRHLALPDLCATIAY